MPGFRTHFLFGKAALEEQHFDEIYRCIKEHPKAYQTGQQGPDIFFYFIPDILRYPDNLGRLLHSRDVMSFFASLFEVRSTIVSKQDRMIADAYIMGFIGHYTLDVIAHPYIQYRVKRRKNKDRPKYAHACHAALEMDIDLALQRHYLHLGASDFRPEATLALSGKEMNVITQLLSRAIKKTYPNNAISATQVRLSILSTAIVLAGAFDPHGNKKKLARVFDQMKFGHAFYSTNIPENNTKYYRDPLNLRHISWNNPWNTKAASNRDFYELMDEAKATYTKRLDMYTRMTQEAVARKFFTKPELSDSYYHLLNNLLSELGDYSYVTGTIIK